MSSDAKANHAPAVMAGGRRKGAPRKHSGTAEPEETDAPTAVSETEKALSAQHTSSQNAIAALVAPVPEQLNPSQIQGHPKAIPSTFYPPPQQQAAIAKNPHDNKQNFRNMQPRGNNF
jgi:hypothetical protein